jgi:hypothetical protein
MENAPTSNDNQPLVISYLTIRKAIGFLGFFLPLILWSGVWIWGNGTHVQPSISDYYYTVMRNSFVGVLCAVALFLFAYRGYEKLDRITGYLGSIFALGVAFFPTSPDPTTVPPPQSSAALIGHFHLVFAGLFFATLIFFSLFLFTRSHSNKRMTGMKKVRNTVYYVCGSIMLACVLAIGLYILLGPENNEMNVVFWGESIALMAFGVSWLVKGEIILKDLKHA